MKASAGQSVSDLDELIGINTGIASMFLKKMDSRHAVGDKYHAAKYAIYAWAHLKLIEADYHQLLPAFETFSPPFEANYFKFNLQDELDRAREFSDYLLEAHKQGRKVILFGSASPEDISDSVEGLR